MLRIEETRQGVCLGSRYVFHFTLNQAISHIQKAVNVTKEKSSFYIQHKWRDEID